MLEVVMDELAKVSVDFYNMTGIKIVLYDENRNVLHGHSGVMCSFCNKVRTSPELAKQCLSSDNIGFDVCEKTRRPYIYKCHMGLAEAIAPICENDIIIGYMMMGQMMCVPEQDDVRTRAAEVAEKYGFDETEFLEFLSDVKVVNTDFINSAVRMMSMCACYLYCNKIIKNRSDILSVQIKKYIKNHLCDELTVSELCRNLYISRSKLYQISRNAFEMGISDYIRTLRIEEAKKKIKTTEKAIGIIAEETGFKDANYFTRIFKKYVGVTPGEYRKS